MSTINSLESPVVVNDEETLRALQVVTPDHPFGDMALALSGGGFRAAAFSLGAMSYLNRVCYGEEGDTLLKHVTFLTSTSGGTITNAYYSASLFKKDFSFAVFYQTMKDFMQGDLVLQEAITILNHPDRWNEVGYQTVTVNQKSEQIKYEKSRNLINSFAKAYDNLLFNAAKQPGENLYDVFFNHTNHPHLYAVCFNATELNNGISFRFQTNGKEDSIRTVGNYYLHFNNAAIARQLKLSDMVATSSCFPGGFEPMVYPTDFVHSGLTNVNDMLAAIDYKNNNPLTVDEIKDKPFCMVDGGVVDNQGLYSMMMEDDFRKKNHPDRQFDLMMVCDVGSYFNTAYTSPKVSASWWGKLSVDTLKAWMPVGAALFIISLLLLIFAGGFWHELGVLFILPSAIYTVLYLYILIKAAQTKSDLAASSWGNMLNKYMGSFLSIPFSRLQQMVADRVGSTLLITTDLFLKQVRRQYYNEFYSMPAYKDRELACLIYEFSSKHEPTRLKNLAEKDGSWWQPGILQPSPLMQHTANEATAMATTLWFAEKPQEKQITRDYIIACGQFTMCYNLLKHIYRMEVRDEKWKTDDKLQRLKTKLLADWDQFCRKPDFMV